MNTPLEQRLSDCADESFVGRDAELSVLQELLEDGGPLVLYVHGIAGLGKSTLLTVFAEHARAKGVMVLDMDCRLMEPTERGFLDELSHQLDTSIRDLDEALEHLSSYSEMVLLSLDHFESYGLMDSWLRQTFLPLLPDHFRFVIGSRQPPVPIWRTSSRWHGLFRTLALEPLDQNAALELLGKVGISEHQAKQIVAVTHGNPLALRLASTTAQSHYQTRLRDSDIHEVMEVLAEVNLSDVDDPTIRQTLQMVSVVRRITRSLLRELVPLSDELWDGLRHLAFVESRRDGLHIHDAVRDAVARMLHAFDPESYLKCRRIAWKQLREELRSAPRSELWRYTADMLYLAENPVVREAFFPSGNHEFALEPALPNDIESIREIIHLHEGEESAAGLEHWWNCLPHSFQVARDKDGVVVAFYCMAEASEITPDLCRLDPIASSWRDHLSSHPLPKGCRALILRRWLGKGPGEAPSAEQAACWLDVKRAYMALRPQLRRVYLTVVDLPTYAPVAVQLGFNHIPEATCTLDEVSYQTALLDFGPASVDGWVSGLVGEELGVEQLSILDHDLRALNLSGNRVALTRLEYGLVAYLEGLDGAIATRDQIHNEVWGSDIFDTSSNVIDAVVKSLRRKLGDKSGIIETVRGHGYRMREDNQ